MLNHLAIIIVGAPNSGKTTTLKHFCNRYYHHKVSTFREGWRNGLMPFLDKYLGVKILAYFLPSSRTEKGKSLKKTFDGFDWTPDFLFMAEQFNGKEYNNTIRLLRDKNFHIKEFYIDNANIDSIWHQYDKKDEQLCLNHRTEQIADYVRNFILSRI